MAIHDTPPRVLTVDSNGNLRLMGRDDFRALMTWFKRATDAIDDIDNFEVQQALSDEGENLQRINELAARIAAMDGDRSMQGQGEIGAIIPFITDGHSNPDEARPFDVTEKSMAADDLQLADAMAEIKARIADLELLAEMTEVVIPNASPSQRGLVGIGDQSFSGVKTFNADPVIPDEAYGSGWNGVLEPPTKNAVYDKIEALVPALNYGYCGGDEIGWSQASAAQNTWYNISDADISSGALNGVTHDNGKLIATDGGVWIIFYSLSVECSASAKHIQTGISTTGGAPPANTGGINHVEITSANAQFTISGFMIRTVGTGETVEVAIRTTDTGTPDLSVDHFMLSMLKLYA